MRIQSLLLIGASILVCAPTYADRDDQGVPFERLQLQIDKLRQRIQALEATQPTGQACPAGQFVTGFNSAGGILCASVTGTPGGTPPPSTIPIPNSFQVLLQQTFNAIAGQNIPLQVQPTTTTNATVQPLLYSLSIGTVQITQTSANSAIIQIAVPNIAVTADVSLTVNGITTTGNVTVGGSASATIETTVVATPSGNRRLGAVTAVNVVPGPISVTGSPAAIVSAIQLSLTFAEQALALSADQILANAAAQILPTLPEF
jgi:hypothetical protein